MLREIGEAGWGAWNLRHLQIRGDARVRARDVRRTLGPGSRVVVHTVGVACNINARIGLALEISEVLYAIGVAGPVVVLAGIKNGGSERGSVRESAQRVVVDIQQRCGVQSKVEVVVDIGQCGGVGAVGEHTLQVGRCEGVVGVPGAGGGYGVCGSAATHPLLDQVPLVSTGPSAGLKR